MAARKRGAAEMPVLDGAPANEAAWTELGRKARLSTEEVRTALTHPNAHHALIEAAWLPTVAFPWRIMVGTLATVAVAVCFRSRKTAEPKAEGAGGA